MPKYDQEMEGLKEALELAQADGDAQAEAEALFGIGGIYYKERIDDAAAEYWDRCEALCRREGLNHMLIQVLTVLGDLAARQERFEAAERRYRETLDLNDAAGNDTGRVQALDRLGQTALSLGHPDQAAERFRQGRALCENKGDRVGTVYFLEQLLPLARRSGDFGHVESLYKRWITLAEQLGDRHRKAFALAGLGDWYEKSGRPELAEAPLALAHDIYLQAGLQKEADLVRRSWKRVRAANRSK
jgi:tetratricopeptide (TPR) repeat protein